MEYCGAHRLLSGTGVQKSVGTECPPSIKGSSLLKLQGETPSPSPQDNTTRNRGLLTAYVKEERGNPWYTECRKNSGGRRPSHSEFKVQLGPELSLDRAKKKLPE